MCSKTFPGRAAVYDDGIIGISLSKEGPFVSGPIDVTWTVDEDGDLRSEEIFVKPLGEGSAYIYNCLYSSLVCDPFLWPSPSPFQFRYGPYEVSSSIVPDYDYIGMRDIGDQVVASLNQHFDDYQFGFITYSTHPDQTMCRCDDMLPGLEPYLEPDLFHEWVTLTDDPSVITQGFSSIRPFCNTPSNSEYRRFFTPYSNALRAIEETQWREGSQRVVILLQDDAVDSYDYSVTVEPITGVTPENVINAALSNQVSLYTATNKTMWINEPLIDMAESTNGEFYYVGDYRPPWDSWVLNLFEAILDDISSGLSTSELTANPLSQESYDNSLPVIESNVANLSDDPNPYNYGVLAEETPVGSPTVTPEDNANSGSSPATVFFQNVTEPGETALVTFEGGPALPEGFQLGDDSTYYYITTTASYEGVIVISISYSEANYSGPPEDLKLFHYEDGSWVDCTILVDTQNQIICGEVTSLSLFTILEPDAL